MGKQIVCVDFDGVLNTYTEWRGPNVLFSARDGVEEFLSELAEKFNVVIFTVRDPVRVKEWIMHYGLELYIADVTNVKPHAVAYIDDRAICFRGDFDQTLRELETFEPFWGEE